MEYNALLREGVLKKMYPFLKGSWDKDKKSFTYQWEENQKLINEIDVTFEDLYDSEEDI